MGTNKVLLRLNSGVSSGILKRVNPKFTHISINHYEDIMICAYILGQQSNKINLLVREKTFAPEYDIYWP